jgi:hypothetical protein
MQFWELQLNGNQLTAMADENRKQDRKDKKEQYQTQKRTCSRSLKSNQRLRESIVLYDLRRKKRLLFR